MYESAIFWVTNLNNAVVDPEIVLLIIALFGEEKDLKLPVKEAFYVVL